VLSVFRRRVASAEVALDLTAETFAAALEASPTTSHDPTRRAVASSPAGASAEAPSPPRRVPLWCCARPQTKVDLSLRFRVGDGSTHRAV
jgi:hypothetical protein